MSIPVYVFMCVNGSCRQIERQGGVKKAQISCPRCGSNMRLIKTEK